MEKQAVTSNLSTASPTTPGSNLPALLCTTRHQKEDTQTLDLGRQTPCWGHTAWSHDHMDSMLTSPVLTETSTGHYMGLSGALVNTRNCSGKRRGEGTDGSMDVGCSTNYQRPEVLDTRSLKKVSYYVNGGKEAHLINGAQTIWHPIGKQNWIHYLKKCHQSNYRHIRNLHLKGKTLQL